MARPALADVQSEVLVREVPRLTEMRLQALEARIEADLHLGFHQEVTAELRGLSVAHPLREQLHAQLMLALYRSGRRPRRWTPSGGPARCWSASWPSSPAPGCVPCTGRCWPATPP